MQRFFKRGLPRGSRGGCYNDFMIGLYVHLPFCTQKCHYCDFVISTSKAADSRRTFLVAFKKEAEHHAANFKNSLFETLYLGGGTPSVLNENEIALVFETLRRFFKFKKNTEITLETNPGDVTAAKARHYRKLGVNRVSLGAQSFNDATLKKINRAHDTKAIADSYHELKSAGFKNINLDLILSLPGETLGDVQKSLEELLKLKPQHVSLYELTIEEKTVFGNLSRQGKLKLPPEESQLAMLSLARNALKENGFSHYELLNYAKPGFESRHNRLYWANQEYLGLGPGAFSYIEGRRFRHSASVEEYLKKAAQGDWNAFEEETLTPEKKETESFLLALRLTKGTPVNRFKKLIQARKPEIDGLKKKNLLQIQANRIQLTPRGQLFAETVFTELS